MVSTCVDLRIVETALSIHRVNQSCFHVNYRRFAALAKDTGYRL